jgi:small-conductance mechanosensitive channel
MTLAGAARSPDVSPTGSTRSVARAVRRFLVPALALMLAAIGAAVAADAVAPGALPDTADSGREPAHKVRVAGRHPTGSLAIFNRPIVTFRASFLGNPPAERAETARQRIATLLERGGDGKVTTESQPQGVVIKVDGALAFVLANDDVDPLRGQTLDSLTRDTVRALTQAIGETHEARSAELMLRAALVALIATAVYALLLWVLRWIGRAVTVRLLAIAGAKAAQIKVGGAEILHRERTIVMVARLLRIGFWGFVLLLTYEWIGFVLDRFPFTRPWGEELNAFLLDTVSGILTAVARAVPDLLVVAVIFVIAKSVNGMLRTFFDGVQSARINVGWLDADSARPTRRLATVAVWIFAVVMAYPYIPGSDTEAFKGLSVLIGLMVSVGASGIVGQAASGLILMYTRTFRPGEYVRIGDHEGTVVEMGMFTSRLRTGLGEELTLPNSLVFSTVVRNYSRAVKGTGFVLDTVVTIGYDAPWRQVHAMLIEAARQTAGVLAEPKPHVFQTALSDFYVEYRLVCQAIPSEPRPRAEVLSCLHANIQDVFNEHGVQIMSPHYLGDPTSPKVVPEAKWHEPPAAPSP